MGRTNSLRCGLLVLAGAAMLAGGCNSNGPYVTPERKDKGLVIILPGIEGESELNRNIRRGLLSAGLGSAMPIHHWGRPVPGFGMLLNQMDVIGNRIAGSNVAKRVVKYQEEYPGRPVHLIGHSGGGGIAVFAAEAMPEDRKVDGVVLLSASISSAYDLTKALKRTRKGIVNFHSEADVGLLVIGTILAGNVDGTHGPAAGAIGFDKPGPSAGAGKREAYDKLHEFRVTSGMMGTADAHSAATRSSFVGRYVARWVTSPSWPATSATAMAPSAGP